MELDQLSPALGSFKLSVFDGKEFHLRKISLDDKKWAKLTFGKSIEEVLSATKEEINKDFEGFLSVYTRVAYHLLVDHAEFKVRSVKLIDEEGVERDVTLGGVKLFETSIQGLEEQIAIMKAVSKTLLASNALPEEMKPELEKKTAEIEQHLAAG